MIPLNSEFLQLCGELDVVVRQILVRVAIGVTTREMADLASELIRCRGLTALFQSKDHLPWELPAAITTSVNEEMVNRIPTDRPLKDGDLLAIQVGVARERVMAYQAWTVPVGRASPHDRRLLDAGVAALRRGVEAVRARGTVHKVSAVIDATIRQAGFQPGRDYCGHAVGRDLHERPAIPCFYPLNSSITGELSAKFFSGQILSVNAFVHAGNWTTRLEPDGWTIVSRDGKKSVHYSMMVVACKEVPSILTLPHDIEWRAELRAQRTVPEERAWWRRFR